MAERIPRESEERLAGRLKAEADASRPEFSEKLHERICRAVLQSQANATSLPKAMRLGRRRMQAAVAAATVVIVSVVAWWATHRQPPGPGPEVPEIVEKQNDEPKPPSDAVDPLRELNNVVKESGDKFNDLDSLVASTMTAQRWGYLDEDARTATRLLIDQLPQFDPP